MASNAMTGREMGPRAPLSAAQDLALIVLFAIFFAMYCGQVLEGRVISVPFAIEQAIVVGIFLARRRSRETSTRPVDWIVATGSFLPLLLRPTGGTGVPLEVIGLSVQMVGLVLTCIGFISLGRSFGVVAADRGLKVNGPYRVVRHPIYAFETITMCGFLLSSFSWWNLGVFIVTMACQFSRMRAEERVLAGTTSYTAYSERVRWRLLPGVY